jgi:hypothetical protein
MPDWTCAVAPALFRSSVSIADFTRLSQRNGLRGRRLPKSALRITKDVRDCNATQLRECPCSPPNVNGLSSLTLYLTASAPGLA